MPRSFLLLIILTALVGPALLPPAVAPVGAQVLVTPSITPTAAQVVTVEQSIAMIYEEQRQTRLFLYIALFVIAVVLVASWVRVR